MNTQGYCVNARDTVNVVGQGFDRDLCGDEILDPIDIGVKSVITIGLLAKGKGKRGNMFEARICRKGCEADLSYLCSKFATFEVILTTS